MPEVPEGYESPLDVGQGSSPATPGVPEGGTPPPGGPAPEKLADGTSPDKPVPYSRFAEVNEELNRLKQELAEFEALKADPDLWATVAGHYAATPVAEPQPETHRDAEPAPSSDGEEDIWGQLGKVVEEKIKTVISPLMQAQAREQAQRAFKMQLEGMKAKYGDLFDPATEGAVCWNLIKQGRARTFEDAFTLAFPDRVAASMRPAPPKSPGNDVGSAGPGSEASELFAKLRDPNTSHAERERLAREIFKTF